MQEKFEEISKELNKFYVYIFLDPRKPGRYEYGDYVFDFKPLYIGKSNTMNQTRRETVHIWEAMNNTGKNPYKNNKIRKIINSGFKPDDTWIKNVKMNLFEQEAFDLEIWLVWAIGKQGCGPLTNMTSGGEGCKGYVWTEEQKLKKPKLAGESNAMFGRFGPDHPGYGTKRSQEVCLILSKQKTGSNNHMYGRVGKLHPRYGTVGPMKGRHQTDDAKECIRQAMLKRFGVKWSILQPDGNLIIIENLRKYCEDNNLRYGTIHSSARKNYSTKDGYTVRKIIPQAQQAINS